MANETTMGDTSRAVEEKIDAAREVAGDRRLRDKVGEAADAMKARAQSLRDKIRDTEWDDVQDGVVRYVRENPGKSLAIAAGVGFLIGFILRRKDD